MAIRQALEAAGADVFLDAATVRGLLPELETKDGLPLHVLGRRRAQLRVGDARRPRPGARAAAALRPVLVWWMCERARRKLGYEADELARPDATIQTADFGVFIDFMSMFQPDDTTGAKPAYTKPAEQASFGRALRNIGLLYGHAGTVVFKMTKTPLPAGGDPIASTTGAGGATSSGASATSRRRRRTASTWRRGRRPRPSAPPGRSAQGP